MGICGALFEERVMDQQTGACLNPDMEFYKLAGIGDIGEIVVHMDITPENDKRGVDRPGRAAGHRAASRPSPTPWPTPSACECPEVPLTPDRVLAALERRNA